MLLLAGCRHPAVDSSPKPSATTLDKIWLVESSGESPPDTSLTIDLTRGRTVVLRDAAPDNMPFLTLHFPPAKDSTRASDTLRIDVHPVPGKYAFTLGASGKLPAGTVATFSYAIHFRTPLDAMAKYPNPGRFELLVQPALIGPDNHVRLLDGDRPGADLLSFAVASPGTYALAVAK